MYLLFDALITSFSLSIIRDKNTFFSYLIKIETLFITFSVSTFNSTKITDKFSVVFSVFVKSLI
jgi:hypothetical protein